jgi:hypothetical protein
MYAREMISTDISQVPYKTFRFGPVRIASHQFLSRRFVEREKKKEKVAVRFVEGQTHIERTNERPRNSMR